MPAVDLFDLIYSFAHGNIENFEQRLDGTNDDVEVVPVTSVSDLDFLIANNGGDYNG